MDAPLPVTAVIPAYNRADLLPRALASVRGQSRPPAEIIVVDDHSADRTGEVAERLGARVIRHDRNRGESAARNTAIEAASQPWIALLDSDDEWIPSHLERLDALRTGHVMAADGVLRVRPQLGRTRFHGLEGTRPMVLDSPADVVYPVNRAPVSSVVLNRQVVMDAGGFDRSLRLCADLDLWIRLLEMGTAVLSPAVGCIYHDHEQQVSRDAEQMVRAHQLVLARYRDRLWFSRSLMHRSEGATQWGVMVSGIKDRDIATTARGLRGVASHPGRFLGAMRIQIFWLRMRWRTVRLG
jgi:glycosyltransferase involved in cell wall biosynthesis